MRSSRQAHRSPIIAGSVDGVGRDRSAAPSRCGRRPRARHLLRWALARAGPRRRVVEVTPPAQQLRQRHDEAPGEGVADTRGLVLMEPEVWGDESEIVTEVVGLIARRITRASDPKTTARPASELAAEAGRTITAAG